MRTQRTANDAPKIAPKIVIDDPKRVHDRSANDAPKIAPKNAIDGPERESVKFVKV